MADPTASCFHCDYDLRGQSADARCPECGTPAVESARRWGELYAFGSPAVLRVAVWAILVGLLVCGVLYGGLILTLFSSGPIGLPTHLFTYLLLGVGGAATLALVVGIWRAARLLQRDPPPQGRLTRKALHWDARVVCGVLLLTWASLIGDYFGIDFNWRAGLVFNKVVTGVAYTAIGIFPMLFLVEVGRRTRFWPHWHWLPKMLTLLWVVLWVAALLVAVPLVADLVNDGAASRSTQTTTLGYQTFNPPPEATPFRSAMRASTTVGGVLYGVGGLGFVASLVLLLLGLRRLPPRPNGDANERPAEPVRVADASDEPRHDVA